MTRGEVAKTLASVARMAADFVEEAEAEIDAKAEEIGSLRAEIEAHVFVEGKLREELGDYERTVAALREQLRAEEARRASYQAVDGAARRFVALYRRVQEVPWKTPLRPFPEMFALLEAIPVEPNDERA